MPKVAILGCGPTGLLAAHACVMNDVPFNIFSKKRKSFLFGSQYLHQSIPGINNFEDRVEVLYQTNGSPVEYRKKVHGTAWDGIVAPDDFEEHHVAWDIRQAYNRLWNLYGAYTIDCQIPDSSSGKVNFDFANSELALGRFELVVSTIPRTTWKLPGDNFVSSKGWALGDAPEHGVFVPYNTPRDNMIICDGTDDVAWSRLSQVFGYTTVEWPHHSKPPLQNVSEVVKPLRFEPGPANNPTKDWLHVGRYGKWHKGVLVTDAFNEVLKATR